MDLFGVVRDPVAEAAWRTPELPLVASAGVRAIRLDAETTGLRWWAGDRAVGWAVKRPGEASRYLPIRHAGGGNVDEATFLRWAKTELRDVHILNASTKFDIHMAYADEIDLEAQGCTFDDVQHWAALLDDKRRRLNLNELAEDYLGKKKIGEDLDKTRMGEYHASRVAPYACVDVDLVDELAVAMEPMLVAQDLVRVRDLESEVIPVTCEMERNAAPIDRELLLTWRAEIRKELEAEMWALWREAGLRVRPSMPAADFINLFQRVGLPLTNFTANGTASFTAAFLKTIEHPTVQRGFRIRKLNGLLTKYYDPWEPITRDGFLRYALHQMRVADGKGISGACSGRYSSSGSLNKKEKFGANIQQVPKPAKQRKKFGDGWIVRRLIVPPSPDREWVDADAKQIEYRVFADLGENPMVLKAYRDDPDTSFHELIHGRLVKIQPEAIYDESKNVNFCKLYGGGPGKIAAMIGKDVEDVREFVALYDREFPEVNRLLRLAEQVAMPECTPNCYWKGSQRRKDARCAERHRGYVKTQLGRRARFGPRDRFYSALNRVIQGTAADVNKRVLVEVHRAIQRGDLDMVLRMTVHDAVGGDVPKGDTENKKVLANILNTQYYPFKVPILWDIAAGPNWADVGKVAEEQVDDEPDVDDLDEELQEF